MASDKLKRVSARRRVGIALALCGLIAAGLAALAAAMFGAVALFSCDKEFSHLSASLPDDAAVRALMSRFPNHGKPNTGCDEDDNTASASIEFRTDLRRQEAVAAGRNELAANGWSGRTAGCYVKRIEGHRVYAEFLEPHNQDDPRTDLVVSLSTRGCLN